ncbi:MAG: purine-nucleoside phosphorylase [Gemmatimonadota bacterium]
MTSESVANGGMAAFHAAVQEIRSRSSLVPKACVVLGTGLGEVARAMQIETTIPYGEIPHFPESTVESHAGRLLLGHLEGVPIVAMQGRFHRYEGYTLHEVTFPLRVVQLLGADTVLLSGLCGGLDPLMSLGDLILLDDQINLMGETPLVGPNLDDFGPRFPDMSEPFDRALQEVALAAALRHGMRLQRGVYAAVVGPNLETRAEYRMLRTIGADVVGMSTAPEVIVARHMGMRVLGLYIISDLCLPDALEPVEVSTIIRVAGEAEPRLSTIIRDVVRHL